jgi:hypothetical protein
MLGTAEKHCIYKDLQKFEEVLGRVWERVGQSAGRNLVKEIGVRSFVITPLSKVDGICDPNVSAVAFLDLVILNLMRHKRSKQMISNKLVSFSGSIYKRGNNSYFSPVLDKSR